MGDCKDATPDLTVAFRMILDASDAKDFDFWLDRLKGAGLDILSVGERGLDVEGSTDAIQEALEIDIEFENNIPRFVGQTVLVSHQGAQPPIVYVPKKPDFF